jgi:hypothetical protein
MLTPPVVLADADLKAVIERGWNLTLDRLEYRPAGFGRHHLVATDDQGARIFVTVDGLNPQSRTGDEVSLHGLHLRPALSAVSDLSTPGRRAH